jgi:TolB protein
LAPTRRLGIIALGILAGCGGEPSPDTEPPEVAITAPVAGVVRGSVPLVAEAEDNTGIAGVQFLVEGVAIGGPITSPPFETVWDASQVPNGTYTLTATASDPAGNEAHSAGVEVTVTNVSSLRVTTVSSGFDIDPDGYHITVDGLEAGTVSSSGSASLTEVPVGEHSIGLASVAGNCAVHLPRTRTVIVAAGTEPAAEFSISCSEASGPTAERILFSRPNLTPLGNGPEQLHAVNADGSGHVQLTDDQFNYVAMAWSPDRSTILFASDRLGPSTYSLYLMDPDGTNIRPVNEAIRAGAASWSPDGTQIVYTNGGIRVINSDGTGDVPLTSNAADLDPAWSPDGGRIVFSRGYRLFLMNVDGSDLHPLSDGVGGESGARWSPDGARILYVGNRVVGLEIYVIQDDGTGRRNVTSNELNDSDPSWSPAGDRIIYSTSEFPATVMYRVQADGSGAPIPVLSGAARFSAWR